MALTIQKLKDQQSGMFITANERLCLTADGRLVTEDNPDAHWLFCTNGGQVLITDAEKHGLFRRMVDQANAKIVQDAPGAAGDLGQAERQPAAENAPTDDPSGEKQAKIDNTATDQPPAAGKAAKTAKKTAKKKAK